MSTARVIGVVLLAVGTLWMLQGVGAVGGSFMSGDALWAVIGLFTAGAGFVLLARSRAR
jgi:hypothetical protein